MRIVLDTSVLIAGLRSNRGGSAEILRIAARGKVTLLMDLKLEMEYREVALRGNNLSAARMTVAEVTRVIDGSANDAEGVRIAFKHRPMSRDEADDLVLDIAINGRANAILTHNVRHFAAAKLFGVNVMRPGEFLVAIGEQM